MAHRPFDPIVWFDQQLKTGVFGQELFYGLLIAAILSSVAFLYNSQKKDQQAKKSMQLADAQSQARSDLTKQRLAYIAKPAANIFAALERLPFVISIFLDISSKILELTDDKYFTVSSKGSNPYSSAIELRDCIRELGNNSKKLLELTNNFDALNANEAVIQLRSALLGLAPVLEAFESEFAIEAVNSNPDVDGYAEAFKSLLQPPDLIKDLIDARPHKAFKARSIIRAVNPKIENMKSYLLNNKISDIIDNIWSRYGG